MQQITNILAVAIVLIVLIFTLNLLNKAAEYLTAKALEAGDADLAELIAKANEAITQAVDFVNQTYVDALKAAGSFDDKAQASAYNKAVAAAMELLTDDGKAAIIEVFGNLSTYLETRIESTVRSRKKEN